MPFGAEATPVRQEGRRFPPGSSQERPRRALDDLDSYLHVLTGLQVARFKCDHLRANPPWNQHLSRPYPLFARNILLRCRNVLPNRRLGSEAPSRPLAPPLQESARREFRQIAREPVGLHRSGAGIFHGSLCEWIGTRNWSDPCPIGTTSHQLLCYRRAPCEPTPAIKC